MPTIITHAIVGAASATAFKKQTDTWRIYLASIICSVLPDADVIAFSFGIPYEHFLGHRGFSHSIFFALVLSLVVVLCLFRRTKLFSKPWWTFVMFFFIISASHGILDAITDGGLGIALLSPFDTTRYFFPWTPLKVSPIGLNAFISSSGFRALTSEMIYVWIPVLTILTTCRTIGSVFKRKV